MNYFKKFVPNCCNSGRIKKINDNELCAKICLGIVFPLIRYLIYQKIVQKLTDKLME